MTSAAPTSLGSPVTHLELQAVDHRRVVLHAAAAHSPKAGPRSGCAPPQRPFIPSSPGGAKPERFLAHPGSRRAHFRCFPDESSMRFSPAANGGSAGLVRMPTWLPSGLSAPRPRRVGLRGDNRPGDSRREAGAERSRPGPARSYGRPAVCSSGPSLPHRPRGNGFPEAVTLSLDGWVPGRRLCRHCR